MTKIIEGVVVLAVRAVETAIVIVVADKLVKLYNEKTQKERA